MNVNSQNFVPGFQPPQMVQQQQQPQIRWDSSSFYPGGASGSAYNPSEMQATRLSHRSSSATGDYEYEPCPYYQTLGFCLEPELCPRAHEFLADYFSESSEEEEDVNPTGVAPA